MNSIRGSSVPNVGKFAVRVSLLLLVTWSIGFCGYAQNGEVSAGDCKIGSRAARTGFWTWDSGSHVKVYILQNDFTSEEILYLTKPLQLWDAAGESTGSGVRLTYAGLTATPLECENCLTILRASVYNKKTRHGSEVKAHGIIGTRIIKYASISIDHKLDSKTLTNAVAHEIGHSFGLLDCYDCREGSTVMLRFTGTNKSNGMEGPSRCDIAQVSKGYKELKRNLRLAPMAIVQEDEGEEPVPDDSPLVVASALTPLVRSLRPALMTAADVRFLLPNPSRRDQDLVARL